MPSIQPHSKILVTGASGFIASWIIHYLLQKGYSVRGAVRSSRKGDFLKTLFREHGTRFEYVLVPNIEIDGAFDDAVRGVQAAVHTASPLTAEPTAHPNKLIGPAVNGTVGLLKSAMKYGRDIKRIVYTSSVSTLGHGAGRTQQFTENDWNEWSIKHCEEMGERADSGQKYRASKTLAERAAWDFFETNKGAVKFDLVSVIPSWVFGPWFHDVQTPAQIPLSVQMMLGGLKSERKLDESPGNYVDVRDVADIHVAALEKDRLGGQRIIASSGPFAWQDLYDALNSVKPPLGAIPIGNPRLSTSIAYPVVHSNAKAKRLLGTQFRTLAETAKESVVCARAVGW